MSDLLIPSHLQFWDGNATGPGKLPIALARHSIGLPEARGCLSFLGLQFSREDILTKKL